MKHFMNKPEVCANGLDEVEIRSRKIAEESLQLLKVLRPDAELNVDNMLILHRLRTMLHSGIHIKEIQSFISPGMETDKFQALSEVYSLGYGKDEIYWLRDDVAYVDFSYALDLLASGKSISQCKELISKSGRNACVAESTKYFG